MVNVHIDPSFDDDERRLRLYEGEIIVYPHMEEIAEFAAFTRDLTTGVLAPGEPTTVHMRRGPEELADILIEFKPRFIHHPESIDHVRRITTALGASPDATRASRSTGGCRSGRSRRTT